MYNPYFNQQQTFPGYQKQEVVRVNGHNGAMSYQMGANSSALLLDDTSPVVWLAQTDGAGYKTVTPYDIKPREMEKPVEYKTLEDRIARLEEAFANEQSNTSNTAGKRKPTKPANTDN